MAKKHKSYYCGGNVVSLPIRPSKRYFSYERLTLTDVLLPFIEGELLRRLQDYQQVAESGYNQDVRTDASRKDGVA